MSSKTGRKPATSPAHERAGELWRTSTLSASQIAAEVGMTKAAVIGYVHRRKIARENPLCGTSGWRGTKEEKLAAIERVRRGELVKLVAGEIGVTVHAFYAWCRAAGVQVNGRAVRRQELEEARRAREAERIARLQRQRVEREMKRIERADPPPAPEPAKGRAPKQYRVTLFGLRRTMCRDVRESDVYGGRYCAQPVLPGRSYCSEHHKLYYVKRDPSRPRRKKPFSFVPKNSRILEDA